MIVFFCSTEVKVLISTVNYTRVKRFFSSLTENKNTKATVAEEQKLKRPMKTITKGFYSAEITFTQTNTNTQGIRNHPLSEVSSDLG